jgi:hypothetical protein
MNIYIISNVVDTAFPVLLATVGECKTSWLDTFNTALMSTTEQMLQLDELTGISTIDLEPMLLAAIYHMKSLENKALYIELNDNMLDRIESFKYMLKFLRLCRELRDGYILISR